MEKMNDIILLTPTHDVQYKKMYFKVSFFLKKDHIAGLRNFWIDLIQRQRMHYERNKLHFT